MKVVPKLLNPNNVKVGDKCWIDVEDEDYYNVIVIEIDNPPIKSLVKNEIDLRFIITTSRLIPIK
jgi:hypothetical protein